MSLAFIFPGQGSQAVGMGAGPRARPSPRAREVFQEVDDALGQKLFALMRDGPEDQLTLTENAQPALMAVSVAVMRTLEKEFGVGIEKAGFVAGHSAGRIFRPGRGRRHQPGRHRPPAEAARPGHAARRAGGRRAPWPR